MRERTVWLSAAAARSAIAFGADIIDRYLDVLARATHVMQVVDALFGLTAIGLSDDNVRDRIAGLVATEGKAVRLPLMTGGEFAQAAFRSALSCLTRREDEAPADHDLLERLSWRPASLRGLGTPEAFRLDPTDIDETGQMLGFRALPHILRAEIPLHYPLRPGAHGPVLPTLEEMPELLTRAWGPQGQTPMTIH